MWQNFILAKKIIKEKYLIHCIIIFFLLLNIFSIRHFALKDYDEGVFALQGQWIATIGAQGKPFNFETPPLYQVLIAIFFKLFQINAIVLPLLSTIFSCITIYLLFHLTKRLYSPRTGIYSIIFFVTTEFFLFFSKSGLSDAVFVCFFMAAILFFIKGIQSRRTNHFILAGLFSTFAAYTKYSSFSLLIIFLIIGLLYAKNINKKWFMLSIIGPLLCYLPYIYLFMRFVPISEITARHGSLLGFNHLKFLFYILVFAPIPCFFAIFYIIFYLKHIKTWDINLYILVAVFLLILGFYYPFFRLAYPLIPFLSIIAARFVHHLGRYKPFLITASVVISLVLSAKTITYESDVPKEIGQLANYYGTKKNIKYIYVLLPPNIYYYVKGTIVVPSGLPWFNIGKQFPVFLQTRKIISRDNNELLTEQKILLIHATTFESIKQKNLALYSRAKLLTRIEFQDAPMYYKDIYNTYRNIKQFYELYLFENSKLNERIDDLWNLSFDPRVTVMIRQ